MAVKHFEAIENKNVPEPKCEGLPFTKKELSKYMKQITFKDKD